MTTAASWLAGSVRTQQLRIGGAPSAVVWPSLVILFIAACAAIGPFVLSQDPNFQDLNERLRSPYPQHLMGTDELGRDTFARLMAGGRVSLAIGVGATIFGTVGGVAVGLLAAYVGGWFDDVTMRVVDVVLAFPALVLVLAVVAVLGSSLLNVMVVLAVVQLPVFARLARATTMSELAREYVMSARAIGVRPVGILVKHVLPNSAAPLVAMMGLSVAGVILNEAALGYLGLSVPPPTPTWGNMLAAGNEYVLLGAWWLTVFPGLAIFATMLSFNVLADSVRDLLDPQSRSI